MILTVTMTLKMTTIFFDKGLNDKVIVTLKSTINTKVVHSMKKLRAFYNNDAKKTIKQAVK